jgi:TonB family protein
LYMAVSPSESGLFSPLPQWRAPWSEFVLSYGAQAVVIAILAWIPVLHPEILEGPKKDYHAIELVPTPVSVNHAAQKQLPKPVLVAKLDPPPADLRLPAPQPQPKPKVKIEDTPAPEIKIATRKPEVIPPAAAPVIPRQAVKTNVFSTGSSAPQTIARAPEKVQTGGFGDPNGLKGEGKQGAKLYAAQAGGFDMPVGPGQGNGSGGAKGIKGTVASADFGNGVATGGKGDGRSNGQGVATGGFGSEQVVHGGPKIAADIGGAATAVEITYKPNPVYTNEARSLKLEGEVLLEVSFGANGTLHVNRVVRGLGHGLDEAATAAANKIRFKPATRSGQPVDSTAVVHVMFQMAY